MATYNARYAKKLKRNFSLKTASSSPLLLASTMAMGPKGTNGFGYDPIFFYPPRGCTFAELTAAQKNQLSHRRRAADALLASLQSRA